MICRLQVLDPSNVSSYPVSITTGRYDVWKALPPRDCGKTLQYYVSAWGYVRGMGVRRGCMGESGRVYWRAELHSLPFLLCLPCQ